MKNKMTISALLSLGIIVVATGTIDLDNLLNYANHPIPNYITKDNTNTNPITDAGATLGRVLFYDKQLSQDGSTSCASCHQQEFAFGDTAIASVGWNGTTGRHSMRLVNTRFAEEVQFFWDERAATLEAQTTQPIQDHIEMGFSDTNGDPDLDSLIRRLETIDYYQYLFETAYGDDEITESRMQMALAQFVRSIQSFDSRFDDGLIAANGNINAPFPNFTTDENAGKALYLTLPQIDPVNGRTGGGVGCQGCHRAPEFDIDPNSGNNGHVTSLDGTNDFTNTRSPSLRDIFDPNGELNGPMMHDGAFTTIDDVLEHYNNIPNVPGNVNLDPRLQGVPPGTGGTQQLNLTSQEKVELEAFLKTLTGNDIYTDTKWSDPFDANGDLDITGSMIVAIDEVLDETSIKLFPNPVVNELSVIGKITGCQIEVMNAAGQIFKQFQATSDVCYINVSNYPSGVLLIRVTTENRHSFVVKQVVKR